MFEENPASFQIIGEEMLDLMLKEDFLVYFVAEEDLKGLLIRGRRKIRF